MPLLVDNPKRPPMETKSIRALVTPSVLRWARELVKMNPAVAAKKALVSEERLLSWEQEEARPTLRQARLLATAYRQPLAALYLDRPPKVKTRLPKDYRRFAGSLMDGISTTIHLDMKEAWEKREIALELLAAQGRSPLKFEVTVSLTDDPENAGNQLRRNLRVSLEEQAGWRV